MPPEYNPAAVDETAIATPVTPPAELGDGGMKALAAERDQRKALEKQNKQLETMLADNKRALEQTNLTLEQKYQADLDATRASYQQQVDAAIAERDARLQAESQARQLAEQRAAILDQNNTVAAIQGGFAKTFDGLLINPRKVEAYISQIADDLTVDNQGTPALILRNQNGEPAGLAPLDQAIAYFQSIYPEDFKPPANQPTGGGFRNLANTSGNLPNRQGGEPLKLSLAEINANPKLFLANRDRIGLGDFEVGK
jgi:multidrug efflux pump subunit AcrA (membrane-fusion protein)